MITVGLTLDLLEPWFWVEQKARMAEQDRRKELAECEKADLDRLREERMERANLAIMFRKWKYQCGDTAHTVIIRS